MSHTPDSGIGSLVKGVVKDVASDLASIPVGVARQAVGLPSANLKHENLPKQASSEANQPVAEKIHEPEEKPKHEFDNNNLQRDNYELTDDQQIVRQVIYGDVSGDQVHKEVNDDNNYSSSSRIPASVVGQSLDGSAGGSLHLEENNDRVNYQSADNSPKAVRMEEVIAHENKDEVLAWLSKAVWSGYEGQG